MRGIHKSRAFLGGVLSAGLCFICSSATAAPLVIDDFSTNQSAMTITFPPAGTSMNSRASGQGLLGAERDLQINLSVGIIAGNSMSATVSSGFLSYSQDATIAGSMTCQWDGADGSSSLNPTGLGGVDLTGGGSLDALQFNVAFDDLPLSMMWTVYSDAGNASSATLALSGLIFSSTSFSIPFSAFTPTLGAGADFASVGAITLDAGSSVTAPDLVVDLVQATATLNAPMTVALMNDVGGDGLANPGDTLRYTVTITNPDDAYDAPATNVDFALGAGSFATLVAGSVTTTQGTVVSGNGGADKDVAVQVGSLADAAEATITFDVIIDNPIGESVQQIVRQGRVTSSTLAIMTDDPGLAGGDDVTSIPVAAAPELSATMSSALGSDLNQDGVLNPGDSVVYTVKVKNTGNRAASGLVFTATLDPNTTLVAGSVTTSAGTVMTGNGGSDSTVRVGLDPLAGAGAMALITFEVTLPASAKKPDSGVISAWGVLTDAGSLMLKTDDPDTSAALDQTAIEVVMGMAPGAAPAGDKFGGGALVGGGFSCEMTRSAQPTNPWLCLWLAALGLLCRRRRFASTAV